MSSLRERFGSRAGVEQRIEKELIRHFGLGAILRPEAEEDNSSFAYSFLCNRRRSLKILASENPSAQQRGVGSEGCHRLGIACDSAPREDLHYLPVVREVQQLYCAKTSSLFGNAPGSPAEFRDQSFVLTGEDEPDELANFRRRYGLGSKVGGAADTLHEARRLIELGFGIGFLPTAVAAPHVAAGTLWPLLLEFQMPSYHLYAVTRAELPDGSPASLLVAAVRKHLRDEP